MKKAKTTNKSTTNALLPSASPIYTPSSIHPPSKSHLNTNNNPIAQRNSWEVHIIRSSTNRRNKLLLARILEDLAGSAAAGHDTRAGRAHIVAEPEEAVDGDGAAVGGDFGLHGGVDGVVGEEDASCAGLMWDVGIGGKG
jgi:hypothetical protein